MSYKVLATISKRTVIDIDGEIYKLDIDEVKNLCKWSNIDKEDLAEKIKGDISCVRRYFRGEIQPSYRTLIKIAEVLDCEPMGLLKKVKVEKSDFLQKWWD